MTLVKLSSPKPRNTLIVSWPSGPTHFRIVSVCSLNALLILSCFSAWKPSGLRYAGHDERVYRPFKQRKKK